MRNMRLVWRTVFNVVIGGMALTVAAISYGRASQPDALYFYLVGLLTWIFGLGIFISRPDDDTAHISYLMSVGLMSVCSVNGTFSPTEQGWQAKFVPLFQFIFTVFLPCLFFRCFAVFPSTKRFAMNRFFKWWLYAPAVLLSAGMSASYLAGNDYEKLFFLIDIRPLRILNILILLGYSVAGHVCLAHTWLFGEELRQRKQAKWLFLGICIGTVPVFLLHTIPSVVGLEFPLSKYSAYTLILIPVCYGIAILRHSLMDIELVINRSSVYAIASSVVLAVYLVISNLLDKAFSLKYPESADAVKYFSILIAVILFAPMKKRVQEFIDRYFDQRRYNYRRTLHSLSETLSTMLRLDELSETLLNQLQEALQPKFAALLLIKDLKYQVHWQIGDAKKLEKALSELDRASIDDRPAGIGEEESLAVPLLRKDNPVGIILLGGKRSGKAYNAEDISLMEIVSHQTAISIENAIMYERLRKQVDLMTGAHNRLVETFRQYHLDLTPEKPVVEGEDIISELNMIAEALIGSSEKLRALDNAKSQFLLNVSHELHTPLASIKGFAQNLLDGVLGELDGRQRGYIQRIFWNSERLIEMINDLLNLSRIAAGAIEINRINLSLFPLISDVVADLTVIAEKKGVSLTLSCPPDVMLFADRDKLTQVIINLINNAIKFTPSGGKVSVYVEDKEKYVDISVEDTGAGMSPESLDEIFERFHQVQMAGSGKSEGMGLGLALVKSFVEIQGGEVSVQSELGKGSRFTVKLKKDA